MGKTVDKDEDGDSLEKDRCHHAMEVWPDHPSGETSSESSPFALVKRALLKPAQARWDGGFKSPRGTLV